MLKYQKKIKIIFDYKNISQKNLCGCSSIVCSNFCIKNYEKHLSKRLKMEDARFTKNDEGFTCVCCGARVEPLGYTSRDHCPQCLCSLHVDINPGDRANGCGGIMFPIQVEPNSKKGYIITYRCNKCGETHRNKSATDDSISTLLSVMNGTYFDRLEKLKDKNNAEANHKENKNSENPDGENC